MIVAWGVLSNIRDYMAYIILPLVSVIHFAVASATNNSFFTFLGVMYIILFVVAITN